MKNIKKVLGFVIAIAMCISLALTAYAKTEVHMPYGTVTGTSHEVTGDAVRVFTSVSRNPDSATLRNSIEFSTGTTLSTLRRASSNPGAVSFIYDFPIIDIADEPFIYAFCGHEVYLSLSSAVYFQTEVDLS